MIAPQTVGDDAVATLRRTFDEAFAAPFPDVMGDVEDLLVVGIGGDRYAVKARETSGLVACRHLITVPGPVQELLGITAVRGAPIGVYDLGALLGCPPAVAAPSWLLVCGGDGARIGLAVDRFEQYVRVPRHELHLAKGGGSRPHVHGFVRMDAGVCGVVDVPSVHETIRRLVDAPARGGGEDR